MVRTSVPAAADQLPMSAARTPAPDSGGQEHRQPPMVAMVMEDDDHGHRPARQPRTGARPMDIPESTGVCAVVECHVRVVRGSRFAALIRHPASDGQPSDGQRGADPARRVVVACSAEHLELAIDQMGQR